MKSILDAPCFYCGFDGAGYWQKGTHDKDCPVGRVGGKIERARLLPFLLKKWAVLIKTYRREVKLDEDL